MGFQVIVVYGADTVSHWEASVCWLIVETMIGQWNRGCQVIFLENVTGNVGVEFYFGVLGSLVVARVSRKPQVITREEGRNNKKSEFGRDLKYTKMG